MSENKDQFDVADLAANLPAAAAALSLEDREGLVNALKNKLQNLAGQHSDVLETLSPNVRKRVEALKGLQSQHDDLVAKFHEERAALEAKYQKLYEPLYEKRYEIVNGVVEVGEPGEAVMEQPQENAPEEKGVPDFWLTAMKTNEVLAEEITERDEGALKYLKDLRWSRIDKSQSFKLEFFFDSNPYFKNAVLTKIYHMVDDDDPILEKAIGTGIEWYQGKCLTQKILKKKPRKGSKNAKPITKTETCDSFFNFFNPPEVPDDDDDDVDDDVAEDLQNLMEHDYEIGSTVKEKIIPRAVSWFTGEAVQGDEFGDRDDEGDDDEHEDGEDEDEDDDDDNDDMEEVESKNVKKGSAGAKKSGRVQPGHGQAGERPPECKQQ